MTEILRNNYYCILKVLLCQREMESCIVIRQVCVGKVGGC